MFLFSPKIVNTTNNKNKSLKIDFSFVSKRALFWIKKWKPLFLRWGVGGGLHIVHISMIHLHLCDFAIHIFEIVFICRKWYFNKRKFNFSHMIPNFIGRQMIYTSRKPICNNWKLNCMSRKSIDTDRIMNCTSRKPISKIWERVSAQEIKFQICKIKTHSCEFSFNLWKIHQKIV